MTRRSPSHRFTLKNLHSSFEQPDQSLSTTLAVENLIFQCFGFRLNSITKSIDRSNIVCLFAT